MHIYIHICVLIFAWEKNNSYLKEYRCYRTKNAVILKMIFWVISHKNT